MNQEKECYLCTSKDFLQLHTALPKSHYEEYAQKNWKPSHWYLCKNCTHVQRYPRRGKELNQLFTESIYNNLKAHSLEGTNDSSDKYNLSYDKEAIQNTAKTYFHYLDFIKKSCPSFELENKKTLDIGCGQGAGLSFFASQGASVFGLEPDPRYVKFIQDELGFSQAFAGIFEEKNLDFLTSQIDLVFSRQSWHFLTDPLFSLKKIHTLLKPEGLLLIDVHTSEKNGNPQGDLKTCNVMEFHSNDVWDSHTFDLFFRKTGFKILAVQNSAYGSMKVLALKTDTENSITLKRNWFSVWLRFRFYSIYRFFWKTLRKTKDLLSGS